MVVVATVVLMLLMVVVVVVMVVVVVVSCSCLLSLFLPPLFLPLPPSLSLFSFFFLSSSLSYISAQRRRDFKFNLTHSRSAWHDNELLTADYNNYRRRKATRETSSDRSRTRKVRSDRRRLGKSCKAREINPSTFPVIPRRCL